MVDKATNVSFGGLTVEQTSTISEELRNVSFSGFTVEQTKIVDLEPVRNRAYLGGITISFRTFTPDVIVVEPVFH